MVPPRRHTGLPAPCRHTPNRRRRRTHRKPGAAGTRSPPPGGGGPKRAPRRTPRRGCFRVSTRRHGVPTGPRRTRRRRHATSEPHRRSRARLARAGTRRRRAAARPTAGRLARPTVRRATRAAPRACGKRRDAQHAGRPGARGRARRPGRARGRLAPWGRTTRPRFERESTGPAAGERTPSPPIHRLVGGHGQAGRGVRDRAPLSMRAGPSPRAASAGSAVTPPRVIATPRACRAADGVRATCASAVPTGLRWVAGVRVAAWRCGRHLPRPCFGGSAARWSTDAAPEPPRLAMPDAIPPELTS